MTNRSIRFLLIDGQTEDSRWIQELLADFDERRFTRGWMHGIELFHLERLTDAITVLEDAGDNTLFEVVLLNPALPDSSGLHSYLRLRNHAPHIPVVIITEEDDPDLAVSMVRAGAQDFLSKSTLDCVPLAHALRLAVERTHILSDLRSLSWRDDTSGLYNRTAFETFTTRDLYTAHRHGQLLAVASIEIDGLTEIGNLYGREEQHLALTECADLIRSTIDAPATLARVEDQTFALSLLVLDESEITLQLAAFHRKFQRTMSPKANRSRLQLRIGMAFRRPGEDKTVQDLLTQASRAASTTPPSRTITKHLVVSLPNDASPPLEAIGVLCENGVGENHHADGTAFRARRDL